MRFGLVIGLLTVTALPACANEASEKAAIRRVYRTIDAATIRRDARPLNAYLTSDYRALLINGLTFDKPRYLQLTQLLFRYAQFSVTPTTIHSLQVNGNRATAVISGASTVQMRDAYGQPRRFFTQMKVRDEWVKIGSAWRNYYTQQLTEEIRVDDRVMRKSDNSQALAPPVILDETPPKDSSLLAIY